MQHVETLKHHKRKITLLRSKVLPIFLYVAIVYVPDTVLKHINDLFCYFV